MIHYSNFKFLPQKKKGKGKKNINSIVEKLIKKQIISYTEYE